METDILERYEQLKTYVKVRRNDFLNLLDYLERETDWLNAPASTRFHLSVKGGLLAHSCNVAETLLKLKKELCPDISDESCVICGLFHDLGKVGMPGDPLYLVNDPSEKQVRYGYKPEYPYRYNKELMHLSVPIRNLYYLLPRISLSAEEVQAIVYHDGQYVEANKDVATKETPLTLLLQYADNWSGFALEVE